MQRIYFRNHAVHKTTSVTQFPPIENYQKATFDDDLIVRIKSAFVIDGEANNPCDELNLQSNASFGPPQKNNQTHVLYFQQVTGHGVKFNRQFTFIGNGWRHEKLAENRLVPQHLGSGLEGTLSWGYIYTFQENTTFAYWPSLQSIQSQAGRH